MRSDNELPRYIDMMEKDFLPQLRRARDFTSSTLNNIGLFNKKKKFSEINQQYEILAGVVSRVLRYDIYGNERDFALFVSHMREIVNFQGRTDFSELGQSIELIYGELFFTLNMSMAFFGNGTDEASKHMKKIIDLNGIRELESQTIGLIEKNCLTAREIVQELGL